MYIVLTFNNFILDLTKLAFYTWLCIGTDELVFDNIIDIEARLKNTCPAFKATTGISI